MNFPKECKLEKACAKDLNRYQGMRHVQLEQDKQGARIVATDGHILAVVPIEAEDGDTSGPVSVEGFLAARKASPSRRLDIVQLTANGSLSWPGVGGRCEMPRPEGTPNEFPRWRQALPKTAPDYTFTLNAALLHALQDALGSESLTLRIHLSPVPTAPNAITVIGASGRYGLIMPITLDQERDVPAQLSNGAAEVKP